MTGSEKTTGYWDVIQSADYPNKLKQRENTNIDTMYHQQQNVIFRRIHHLYSVFHPNPCCLSLQPNRWSEPTASLLGRILLLDIWHTNLPDEETMLWSEEQAAQRLWRQKPDNISWSSPVKTDLTQQDLSTIHRAALIFLYVYQKTNFGVRVQNGAEVCIWRKPWCSGGCSLCY